MSSDSLKISVSCAPTILRKVGLTDCTHVTSTLQGSTWRSPSPSISPSSSSDNNSVDSDCSIFKIADRILHEHKAGLYQNKVFNVSEDILMEKSILKYLTQDPDCPDSIVKYKGFFKNSAQYCLQMEDGGMGLFEFVEKSHKFVKHNYLDAASWRQTVKVIFSQMVESLAYCHSKNVAHFDVSLENFLINDVPLCKMEQPLSDGSKRIKIRLLNDKIQVKLCDFGLSKMFHKSDVKSTRNCGKHAYKSPEMHANKKFCPYMNDIWCLGVSLFALAFGCFPFDKAVPEDENFQRLMNGEILQMLAECNKLFLIDSDLFNLFEGIFREEKYRMSLRDIQESAWMQSKNE